MNLAEKISIPGLLKARLEAGITRAEFVGMSNVSYSTICRAERGEPVKHATAKRLAKALRMETKELEVVCNE